MDWMSLMILILDIIVLLIHILALTLLITVKQNNVLGSQKILLIALCVTELTYAVVNLGALSFAYMEMKDIYEALLILNFPCLILLHVFLMYLITIDRFLEIYLNIKYNIMWSPKKTMFVILLALTLSFLSLIPSFVIGLRKILFFVNVYILPILELIFIIAASVIYSYIIKKVLQYRRNNKRLREQLHENNKVVHHTNLKNPLKIFAPTLIIITFVLFMVGSNVVSVFAFFKKPRRNVRNIPFILLPVGFVADAITYIFNLKSVRLSLRRKIWPRSSTDAR